MSTTLPVPNQSAAIASVKANGKVIGQAFLIPPWNSWFQQFSQKAPAVVSVDATATPFTANANGTLIITGTNVILTRGSVKITLGTGQFIIPISISDTISWTAASSIQFLGA